MNIRAYRSLFYMLIIIIIIISGCNLNDNYPEISLSPEEKDDISTVKSHFINENATPFKMAISAMVSPSRIRSNYYGLHQYISEKIQQPVDFIQRSTYGEINNMIKYGEIDLALVCTWSYIDVNNNYGLDIIAVPVMEGKTKYQSYIISSKESDINKLEDFRNKTFAFTDTLSFSGRLYMLYLLHKNDLSAETFFSNYIYTQSHDNSIRAVAEGVVDGAAVASYIYSEFLKEHPEVTDKIKIIDVSPSVDNPPVVAPANKPADINKNLSEIFLQMHKDTEGKKILKEMGIDYFIAGKESDYDYINEIITQINEEL